MNTCPRCENRTPGRTKPVVEPCGFCVSLAAFAKHNNIHEGVLLIRKNAVIPKQIERAAELLPEALELNRFPEILWEDWAQASFSAWVTETLTKVTLGVDEIPANA